MMKKMMKGFTLAEVLTTLMVIGVVAALTIPTLINSTGEAEHKAAFKKAVAALENGIGQLNAKETSCVVTDSESLAECFRKNVLQGTRVDYQGINSGTRNVILTPDGVAYQFIFRGTAKDKGRTFDSICPSLTRNGAPKTVVYRGDTAKCGIIVDLDGFKKGNTSFYNSEWNDFSSVFFSNADETDQQLLLIGSDGVYPYNNGSDERMSQGYRWMYGSVELDSEGNSDWDSDYYYY